MGNKDVHMIFSVFCSLLPNHFLLFFPSSEFISQFTAQLL